MFLGWTRYRLAGPVLVASLWLASSPTAAEASDDMPILLGTICLLASEQDYRPEERFELARTVLAATQSSSLEPTTPCPIGREYVAQSFNEGAPDGLNPSITFSEYRIPECRYGADALGRTLESVVNRNPARDHTHVQERMIMTYDTTEVGPSRFSILVKDGTVQNHSFPPLARVLSQRCFPYAVVKSETK